MRSVSKTQFIANKRLLAAAVGLNLLLGVLYAWSIFLEPIEMLLQQTRTVISFAPALGLVCFTIGIYNHGKFTERFTPRTLVTASLACAGLGFLLFGYIPAYASLLLGYGVFVGGACGIGYSTALYLARKVSVPSSGWCVGLVVAAFAIGGIGISALSTSVLPLAGVSGAFKLMGWAFVIASVVLGSLTPPIEKPRRTSAQTHLPVTPVQRRMFLRTAFGYYSFCYLGLLMVSHGKEIVDALGLPAPGSELTPIVLNTGYICGACGGGIAAERFSSRATPAAFMAATLFSVIALNFVDQPALVMMAVAVIGAGFGSIVSVFIVLLAINYEEVDVATHYGRLNVGYGLAGFSAPAITAWLYDLQGQYDMSIWLAGALGFCGLVSLLSSNLLDGPVRSAGSARA